MKKNAPYELPEDFSRRIGLTFNDGLLLYRALTHRSFLNEHADAIKNNVRRNNVCTSPGRTGQTTDRKSVV